MIDYFASQDIERDGETLAQWLARKLHETPMEARARLAQMQRAGADVGGDEQPAHLRQVA